ncbi:hypothetical protein AB0O76_26080 [Streptomyces sp. NPDC086554]|uniref:hypothetical protein n=1 Tax=Streptomyces sp. NPDC086554 TaxID=3154864 RepID=UPI00343A44AA
MRGAGGLEEIPKKATHWSRKSMADHSGLSAAFDVATGEVISALHRRHRAAEFKKFLIRMDKEVPAHLQVHLIEDKAAVDLHAKPVLEGPAPPTRCAGAAIAERAPGSVSPSRAGRTAVIPGSDRSFSGVYILRITSRSGVGCAGPRIRSKEASSPSP